MTRETGSLAKGLPSATRSGTLPRPLGALRMDNYKYQFIEQPENGSAQSFIPICQY